MYTINVWDTSSGMLLRNLNGHSNPISVFAFSPDSHLLASGSLNGSLKLWEPSSGAELLSEERRELVKDLAFSLDGKLLASVDRYSIQLWNANFVAVQTPALKGHSEFIGEAAFSSNGNMCATGSFNKTIKLWDAGSGEVLGTFEDTSWVNAFAISPNGTLLASGRSSGASNSTINLWDTSSGELLGTFEEVSLVKALAFSPDGKLLALGSYNTVKLWDLTSNADLRTLGVHSYHIIQVIFSSDGKLIVSQDSGEVFKIWDASSGRVLERLQIPFFNHDKISFSDDGSVLQRNGKPCYIISKNPGLKIAKSLSIEREWVVWGTERFLWLPPEYRSDLVEVHRGNIAICLKSGLVVFIQFAFED
jgi:WD40 repeat protein